MPVAPSVTIRALAAPFVVIALLSVSLPAAQAQVWERPVAPGIVFRMERQENPARNLYGLRIDPRQVRAESALAKGTIYDTSPSNGRAFISSMVRDQGAIGGVNGDFFQWGEDPGGDPVNLMVRGGELLSLPGKGNRGFAAGWTPGATELFLGSADWQATFSVNGGTAQPLHGLNERADKDTVVLYTDTAAYAYPSVDAVAARVRANAPYRLGTDGTALRGAVVEVAPLAKGVRTRIAPGEFLLVGAGSASAAVQALKPGDRVDATVRVTGFDWAKSREVMGGGPILLRDGKSVLPAGANDFNDTRHPRTVLGRTAEGELWFVVIDGRQTMSVGASLAETAEAMRRWGCVEAINLDGGGSSTLNLLGLTLNRPSGGVERAVANGVLFYGEKPASPAAAEATASALEIRLPQEPLAVGQTAKLTVMLSGTVVPAAKTLFVAQGAAWIDQEGTLHAVREGDVEVAVLAEGKIARAKFKVGGAK
jgi:hypothetical protein